MESAKDLVKIVGLFALVGAAALLTWWVADAASTAAKRTLKGMA